MENQEKEVVRPLHEQKALKRRQAIIDDSRFQSEAADVSANAYLALVQMGLKGEISGIELALGLSAETREITKPKQQ